MRPRALTRPTRAAVAGIALVALVLGATSCAAGRPSAATVAGRAISTDRLDELIGAFLEGAPETFGEQIEGDGEGTYQMGAAADVLGTLILQLAQSELADRRGAIPTPEERDEAEELVRTSFVQGAEVPPGSEPTEEQTAAQESSNAVFDALSEDTQDWMVDLRAATLALIRVASADSPALEEQAREVYEADPSQFEALCLSAIFVEAPDADAVRARLDAGEDFATVSSEVSLDPGLAEAGGDLGQCLTPSQLLAAQLSEEVVQLVSELPEGDYTDAVDLGDGAAYFFLLRERRLLSFDEVQPQIEQSLPDPGEAALAELVQSSIDDIDVRVDPRFGTWDAEAGIVVPPDGATPAADDLIDGGAPTAPVPVPVPGG